MDSILDNFEIYLGTNFGSLINFKTNKKEDKTWHLRNDEKFITSLSWGRTTPEIVIGYKNGKLKIYDTVTTKSVNIGPVEKSPIVGIVPCDQDIYFATNSGTVYYWSDSKVEKYLTNENSNKTIEKMVVNPYKPNVIGFGGVNNDIKLYDLETKKVLFQGKADRHDELELAQRVFINSIVHLRPESGMDIATVSQQGQIRLYDTRTQRRPIKIFKSPNLIFSSMSTTNKDLEVVVGCTKGYIQHFDLRGNVKPLKTFKGLMGGIADLVGDAEKPVVACCSLDRYFRMINLQDKKMEYQEYIKIQSLRILMRPISVPLEEEDRLEDAVDEWNINTTKRHKKQKAVGTKKIKSK